MLRIGLLLVTIVLSAVSARAAELMAADRAAQKAAAGTIKLIDIRRPQEWKQSGVAMPAHLISMHHKDFLQRLAQLIDGKKTTAIALICATGARSTWLSAELEKRGYTNVINVREGMMGSKFGPGWLKRGLPVAVIR